MRSTASTISLALTLVLALALVACSDDDTPTQPGADDDTVTVRDNFFQPATTRVDPGDTVTWTWQGSNTHNVTWVSAALPNSATQSSGSHAVTMPGNEGTFDYYCTIHGTPTSGMRGSVRVED